MPEVALDDCVGSVKAVMTFVFTDHEKQFGWGKVSPERLTTTWEAVAESQELRSELGPEPGLRHVAAFRRSDRSLLPLLRRAA